MKAKKMRIWTKSKMMKKIMMTKKMVVEDKNKRKARKVQENPQKKLTRRRVPENSMESLLTD